MRVTSTKVLCAIGVLLTAFGWLIYVLSCIYGRSYSDNTLVGRFLRVARAPTSFRLETAAWLTVMLSGAAFSIASFTKGFRDKTSITMLSLALTSAGLGILGAGWLFMLFIFKLMMSA